MDYYEAKSESDHKLLIDLMNDKMISCKPILINYDTNTSNK